MSVVIVAALLLMLLAFPLALRAYLERLPPAPACPSCGTVTGSTRQGAVASVLLGVVATTAVCECEGCGWRGRMRWRWAARWVRDRRGG